jgi:hypothetical protein
LAAGIRSNVAAGTGPFALYQPAPVIALSQPTEGEQLGKLALRINVFDLIQRAALKVRQRCHALLSRHRLQVARNTPTANHLPVPSPARFRDPPLEHSMPEFVPGGDRGRHVQQDMTVKAELG